MDSVFCSCSNDRSFAIWDYRQNRNILNQRPSKRYNKDKDFDYTACLWQRHKGNELLFIGNAAGYVDVFDPRNFAERLQSWKLYRRPIQKIKSNPNDQAICVMAASNEIKVLECGHGEAKEIYTNSDADDFVRDICWIPTKANETKQIFYSVGWNHNVQKHAF